MGAFLLAILGICGCPADVVKFGTSEALTGHVVSVHKGVISFQSDHFGLLSFRASADMTISVDGLVTVRSEGGREYVGIVKPNTGPQLTLLIDGGVQEATLAPEKIVSFASTPNANYANGSITATETRENPWEGVSSEPKVTGPWSANSLLSFTGVQATKNRRLIDWTGELTNSTGKGDFDLTAERLYSVSSNSLTGKQFVDDDVTQGEANYKKPLTTRSSLYLDFQGLSDQINFIDYRLTASGGIRYKLIRTSSVKFTLFGGPSWLDYKFLPNEGYTTPGEDYGAIQFGYTSEYDLPGNNTIHQDFTFNQGYNSGHSFESLAIFRIRHTVTSWLYLEGAVRDDYNSLTAYEARPNRLRYTGGVGVKFNGF